MALGIIPSDPIGRGWRALAEFAVYAVYRDVRLAEETGLTIENLPGN